MDVARTGRPLSLSLLISLLAPIPVFGTAKTSRTIDAVGDPCAIVTTIPAPTPRIGPVGPPASADETRSLAIVLRVRDTARVPNAVLTQAQRDVTGIYREAGVDTRWFTKEALSAESDAFRKEALTVAILSRHQARKVRPDVRGNRLGFTTRGPDGTGRVAFVLYDRVEMLTGANGLRRARILAIAIAHESGHLLLPFDAHSRTGLMRAVDQQ